MSGRSRYDELHDEFAHTTSPKAGARYERLMALVAGALHQEGAVVHDMKLVGESGVKHQIDVSLEFDGQQRRVLMECKDFERSGSNVGLGIVRDFWGVVDDVKPDAAMVITCNGFTGPAIQFARHKGIQLAILREHVEESTDEDGQPIQRQVILKMTISERSIRDVSVVFEDDEVAARRFTSALTEAGFENSILSDGIPLTVGPAPGGPLFLEWVQREGRMAIPEESRRTGAPVAVTLLPGTVWVGETGPLAMPKTVVYFNECRVVMKETVFVGKIAKLLLDEIDGETVIIYDDQLRRFAVDDDGSVIRRSSRE